MSTTSALRLPHTRVATATRRGWSPPADRRIAWWRRGGTVASTVAALAVLDLATAGPAAAFDLFSPVKRGVQAAASGLLDQLAQGVCGFVADLVHGILGYADKGLGVDFSADWFRHNYQNMMLGGFLMGLAIMIVQCTAAALRRNPTQMLTAVSATGLGVLASFGSLSLIMLISAAVDDWCAAVTGGASIAEGTAHTIRGLPAQIGDVGAILVAVLYLVFGVLLFLVLIVRRLGIFVVSLFIPVYAGGLGGGWTNGMVKRAAELLLVLLLSKLAIIATFTLGEAMLVGDTSGLDIEISVLGGVVVMAFAVLSPLGVLYLVAFADGLLVGQLASSAHHGRGGLAGARNQVRGHDGAGNRAGLGRLTGAGRSRVRRDQQGSPGGVLGSARRAAHRLRPASGAGAAPAPGGSRPGAVRAARARGARRAASPAPTTAPTKASASSSRPTPAKNRSRPGPTS